MEFDHESTEDNEEETVELLLRRRSIVVLMGEARYGWKHSIPARKKDWGKLRTVRLSMTWRVMNWERGGKRERREVQV